MNTPLAPFLPPDGGFLSRPWQGHGAGLTGRRLRSSVAVIRAHGGIDASSAETLTQYTLGYLMRCRALILDLRDLNFFGVEGISALDRISICCAHAGIGWAVVSGPAVSRMLRIGDPEHLLPTAGTVEEAMSIVEEHPHRPQRAPAAAGETGQSARCERAVCSVCGGTREGRVRPGVDGG